MNALGIDVSTHNIDMVFVDIDNAHAPNWCRFPLAGADAWERTRNVAQALPAPGNELYWDTLAIGIEVAHGPSSGAVNRVIGAVLTRLPRYALVKPWTATEWKRAVKLPGNATKQQVMAHVAVSLRYGLDINPLPKWDHNACDAWCIAVATQDAIDIREAA